jgi:hypothetical protein
MIPPLRRLPEVPELVRRRAYFVVHAPRQTGKTTAIRALAEELTASGRYAALRFSCEVGQPFADDAGTAQRGILDRIRDRAESALPAELRPPPWPDAPDATLFAKALAAWARACPKQAGLAAGGTRAEGAAQAGRRPTAGEGLAQLDGYLDRLGLGTGVLVIFDRRPKAAPIAKRTRFEEATSPSGRTVTVLRA